MAGYAGEQLQNAATILRVGKELGFDPWGQTLAVMTAMGESSLRNLPFGDAVHGVTNPDGRPTTSVGLFQQQDNWGSYADRMTPDRSARLFFQALGPAGGLARARADHRREPGAAQRRPAPLRQVLGRRRGRGRRARRGGTGRPAEPDGQPSAPRRPSHRAARATGARCPRGGARAHTARRIGPARRPVPAVPAADPAAGYNLGPVAPHTAAVAAEIGQRFAVAEIGGYRANAVDSGGHPAGLALDFMVGDDVAKGDAIVDYAVANAERLGVDYIIWRQRIWFAASPQDGWRQMDDRGSPTANHMDHPHINLSPAPGPGAGALGCLMASSVRPAAFGTGQWIAPLDAPVSSHYGPRVLPVGEGGSGEAASFHIGTDLVAACGTPVYAAAEGTVTYAAGSFRGLTGRVIFVDHGGGVETSYNHMDAGGVLVRAGDHVAAGQVIALVGDSGNSTGCHLHFGVYENGRHVDPEPFMAAHGAPLG